MAPAEPIGTSVPPSRSATSSASAGGRVRETTTRGGRSTGGAGGGAGSLVSVSRRAGSATAPAASAPCSTSATCTAQSVRSDSPNSRVPSSGSTIQARSAPQPPAVVRRLLREHRIVGEALAEQREDQVVRATVALRADVVGGGAVLEPGADLQQQRAGGVGDLRCRPGVAQPRACLTSSVSFGTTCCTSPTMPKSANSKIGAFASLLIATIVPELCIPTLCWIAPLIPQAT